MITAFQQMEGAGNQVDPSFYLVVFGKPLLTTGRCLGRGDSVVDLT